MVKMRALKSFTGSEGKMRAGREFDVKDEGRAGELVRRNLAQRVVVASRKPVAAQPNKSRPFTRITRFADDKD